MNFKNRRNYSTSTAKCFNMMQFLDKYHNHPDACRGTMIQFCFLMVGNVLNVDVLNTDG